MTCKSVITIGRQFGSGGRIIGQKLAEILDIPFYDRELITLSAKQAGVNPNVFANIDERAVNSLLYALSMGIYNIGNTFSPLSSMPDNDRLYIAQHKVISDIAKKGSCVIVGRCADYILKDLKNCTKVFIYAPIQYRIKRACELYDIPSEKAEDIVRKTDKTRANYYNFYTTGRWGDIQNYNLCLDSSSMSLDKCAEFLSEYIKMRDQ